MVSRRVEHVNARFGAVHRQPGMMSSVQSGCCMDASSSSLLSLRLITSRPPQLRGALSQSAQRCSPYGGPTKRDARKPPTAGPTEPVSHWHIILALLPNSQHDMIMVKSRHETASKNPRFYGVAAVDVRMLCPTMTRVGRTVKQCCDLDDDGSRMRQRTGWGEVHIFLRLLRLFGLLLLLMPAVIIIQLQAFLAFILKMCRPGFSQHSQQTLSCHLQMRTCFRAYASRLQGATGEDRDLRSRAASVSHLSIERWGPVWNPRCSDMSQVDGTAKAFQLWIFWSCEERQASSTEYVYCTEGQWDTSVVHRVPLASFSRGKHALSTVYCGTYESLCTETSFPYTAPAAN